MAGAGIVNQPRPLPAAAPDAPPSSNGFLRTAQATGIKVMDQVDPGVDHSGAGWGTTTVSPQQKTADDEEKARRLRDGLLAAANNPQVRPAPQVAPAPTVNAATVTAPQLAPVERPVAVTAGAPGAVIANGITAAGLPPAERAMATMATAAPLNMGPQDQIRARQVTNLGSLEAAAAGAGPSAAELTMRAGLDRAIKEQQSRLAGVRGTGRVTAGLTAAHEVAGLQQEAARQGAIIKAQEQNQARGQLIGALEGTRGADIGLATTDAGLRQQTAIQNALSQTGVSQFNAGAGNEAARVRAGFEQQSSVQNAENALRAGLANQSTEAQLNISNANAQNTASLAGAQAANQAGLAQGQMDLAAGTSTAGFGQQANVVNAANALQGGTVNAGLTLQQQQQDDAAKVAAIQAALGASGQVLNANDANQRLELAKQQLALARTQGERDFWSKAIGTLLTVGGAVAGGALAGPAGAAGGAAVGGAAGNAVSV